MLAANVKRGRHLKMTTPFFFASAAIGASASRERFTSLATSRLLAPHTQHTTHHDQTGKHQRPTGRFWYGGG